MPVPRCVHSGTPASLTVEKSGSHAPSGSSIDGRPRFCGAMLKEIARAPLAISASDGTTKGNPAGARLAFSRDSSTVPTTIGLPRSGSSSACRSIPPSAFPASPNSSSEPGMRLPSPCNVESGPAAVSVSIVATNGASAGMNASASASGSATDDDA